MQRRKFLSTIGTGAMTVPFLGVANAKSNTGIRSFDKIYNQALQVRKETEDHGKFVKYLEDHGANIDTTHQNFNVPTKTHSDGVSTQAFEFNELDTDVTITSYWDCSTVDFYADFYWSWTANYSSGDGKGGEPGPDIPRLSWNNNHFDYLSNYTTDSRTSYSNAGGNFCAWEFKDDGLSGDPTYSASAGVKIDPLSTDQTRRIYGKYTHTYQDLEVCSVTADSEGTWTVTYCNQGDKWNSDPVNTTYSERTAEGPCHPTM